MQIYLPIAEIPVNIFLVLALGLITGFLAGMFGIGGGFLATPFLIFIGVPSAVSVSTSTNQIISASVSGLLAHFKKGNVDIKMGLFLVLGGIIGSSIGVSIFKILQNAGQIDLVIALTYVLFLGAISLTMLSDSFKNFIDKKFGMDWQHHHDDRVKFQWLLRKIDKLPLKTYFNKSEVYISIFVPIIISFGIGILVSLMGIGGGFLMIPAMIYILQMPSHLVVGTSLFQIVFIASNATFLQAIAGNNVDIVLGALMIFSSAIGAQFGSRIAYKVDANATRAFLAVLLLLICFKMMFQLFAEPSNIYSLEILK
ncbi:MAG: sulfite exporter TauE/SafE family protein [Alphaproteobacteria bacterium]|nr:sulfite exporter TauE/SafE family protein [Alphaproteobacteria bacterium]